MQTVPDSDGLFSIPPSEFIAARDALVKQLRSQGRRDVAAAVKSLRRPSVLAWGLNQLSRRHHPAVAKMLESTDRLVAAHRRVLGGAPAQLLREATAVRGAAIGEIRGALSELLDESGQPSNKLEVVDEMMKAIATDSEARQAFASGRLVELTVATDFGGLAGIGAVPDLPAEPRELPVSSQWDEEPDSSAAYEAELDAAAAEAERASRRAADAARAVMIADAEAQRARSRVDNARDGLASALEAADKADETLAVAQDAAEVTRAALKEVEKRTEELRRSVDVS